MDQLFDVKLACEAQANFQKEKGYPDFAPKSGRCFSCGNNIYSQINDAIVIESSALSSFIAIYSEYISAIDTAIVDGKSYFAVIGNGALLNNLGEMKVIYSTIPAYSYFRYFTYLNAYQVKMAAETFELCAYDADDNEVLNTCATPRELLNRVNMLPNCFFELNKDGDELHSGISSSMQDYLIILGAQLINPHN